MTALPRTTFAALRLWVLAWFVASMGVAIASPLVNPQSFEVICSGTGAIKLLVQTDDGTVEMGAMGMDCPLCATPCPHAGPHRALDLKPVGSTPYLVVGRCLVPAGFQTAQPCVHSTRVWLRCRLKTRAFSCPVRTPPPAMLLALRACLFLLRAGACSPPAHWPPSPSLPRPPRPRSRPWTWWTPPHPPTAS